MTQSNPAENTHGFVGLHLHMENAMIELGASSCEMEMEIEELQDKRFLIAHKFTVR